MTDYKKNITRRNQAINREEIASTQSSDKPSPSSSSSSSLPTRQNKPDETGGNIESRKSRLDDTKETTKEKKKYILDWTFHEESSRRKIKSEWKIADVSISEAFFKYKFFSERKAKNNRLNFVDHPDEILSLNSILLLEENRVKLDISSTIHKEIFKQLKSYYIKNINIPESSEELCRRCSNFSRVNNREDFVELLETTFDELKQNLEPKEKDFLRTCNIVWIHISENWTTSFNSHEDTHVHRVLHQFIRPFFPDELGRTIEWSNKLSIPSVWRKSGEKGQGHKPDFMITVDISGDTKYEILFGLFKPSFKTNTLINVYLVELAVMMKDSLDMAYLKHRFELDLTVFGILGFGYNVRIYAMDLVYDGIYRMYLLGEFELPRSNLSLSLVKYCICEMKSLKCLVEKNIKRVPPFLPSQTGDETPTRWTSMTRKTLATPKKVEA